MRLTFAGVSLSSNGGLPRYVVVEVIALFTVKSFGVMRAFAPSIYHIGYGLLSRVGDTSAGVSIAGTAASDHHIVYGIIILFFDFISRVEQIIAQIVKFSEIDSQVCHFQ